MNRRTALRTLVGLVGGGLAGCLDGGGAGPRTEGDDSVADASDGLGPPPTLESAAFDDGERVPVRHTCDGANVSPPLSVGDVPGEAASLALAVDDPDAPGRTFTHWLVWGLPPSTRTVPEAVPRGETVEALGGGSQGTNDAGRVGYSGPCPPPADGPHTYRFRLLALAEPLGLPPGADRSAFDEAVAGVDRSSTLLRGNYDR